MKKLIKKLRNKCGETLVEAIASILIFTLSSIILLSMVASAGKINADARAADAAMRAELEATETQESAYKSNKTITITCNDGGDEGTAVSVNTYSLGDGKLYSFKPVS